MKELTIQQALKEHDLMLTAMNIRYLSVCHKPKLKIKVMLLLGESKIFYTGDYAEKDGCYIVDNVVILTSDEIMYSNNIRVPVNHVMFIFDMPDYENC